jgi:hypothetical protein
LLPVWPGALVIQPQPPGTQVATDDEKAPRPVSKPSLRGVITAQGVFVGVAVIVAVGVAVSVGGGVAVGPPGVWVGSGGVGLADGAGVAVGGGKASFATMVS